MEFQTLHNLYLYQSSEKPTFCLRQLLEIVVDFLIAPLHTTIFCSVSVRLSNFTLFTCGCMYRLLSKLLKFEGLINADT